MIRKSLIGLVVALALVAVSAVALWPTHPALRWVQSQVSPTTVGPSRPDERPTPPSLPVSAASPTVVGNATAADLLKLPGLQPGNAETRLIEIFSLLEQSQFQQALVKSSELTRDHPNFHLAQLVHGDLLKLRFQSSAALGDVSEEQAQAASAQLASLRAETRKRLHALQNRPPAGSVPHQLLAVSAWSKHAIAIDASHSRLYLFENTATGGNTPNGQLKLIADFFISVGKSGINKKSEGDGKTPLGNYYITSVKDRKSLPAFYGAGALPINYPNAFDVHQGRTGSGIWLHGSPPNQFVRATLASEGCVVLSNPDMERLLEEVSPKTTPVVIAERLQWVDPSALQADRSAFEALLQGWQSARSNLTATEFRQRYGPTNTLGAGQGLQTDNTVSWLAHPDAKLGFTQLSLLQSRLPTPSMVATFEETANGQPTGVIRRQYWLEQAGQWQLLQDTVLSGAPSAQLRRPTLVASKPADAPPTDRTEQHAGKANTPAHADHEAVRQAVNHWAKAWSQKNMAAYLKAYDASFDTPNGQSRKAWEQDRRDRIVYKTNIQITLSNMTVNVKGQTATVRFSQRYQADQLNVSGQKTLKLIKRGNQWLITHEQVGNR